MWMCYSEQNWRKAEDLQSAVERLCDEISALIFSEQHDSIYDMQSIQDDESRYKECQKQVQRYNRGLKWCRKFLDGNVSIQKFCREMIAADMKTFLVNIKQYLPQKYIVQFNIYDDYE